MDKVYALIPTQINLLPLNKNLGGAVVGAISSRVGDLSSDGPCDCSCNRKATKETGSSNLHKPSTTALATQISKLGRELIWVGIIFIFLFSLSSLAAIPVHQAGAEKHNLYIDNGVFIGGQDHGPVKLLNVRHSLKGKLERLVFDEGTERPGFFHISIQNKPNRIVIDLEDVTGSKVSSQQISHLFLRSPYLSKVSLFEDTVHQNMTLELPLKEASQIEVFELVSPGKQGRIVMDITNL